MMTLLDRIAPETFRERSTPVLETERLVLRAPRLEDAKAIVTLADDRRHRREHAAHPSIPTRWRTHRPSSARSIRPAARDRVPDHRAKHR